MSWVTRIGTSTHTSTPTSGKSWDSNGLRATSPTMIPVLLGGDAPSPTGCSSCCFQSCQSAGACFCGGGESLVQESPAASAGNVLTTCVPRRRSARSVEPSFKSLTPPHDPGSPRCFHGLFSPAPSSRLWAAYTSASNTSKHRARQSPARKNGRL